MAQTLHIFRKDAYHLRIEITLFLIISSPMYGLRRASRSRPVGRNGCCRLPPYSSSPRVLYAEPIPGGHHFCVTRACHRMSLAAAKLVFIVAFVCAAIGADPDAGGRKLPAFADIQGLLWSEVLTLAASIFVAALAALTSGAVLFISTVLPVPIVVRGIPDASTVAWMLRLYRSSGQECNRGSRTLLLV